MSKLTIQRIFREAIPLSFLVIGILAARSSFADHYYVPSGSMEYTLVAGDRVVVDKRAYGIRVPFTGLELTSGEPVRRGDVVIFDSPRDGKRLIKRIVAIGGDDVVLREGRLAINGEWLAVNGADAETFNGKIVQLNLRDGGGPDLATRLEPGTVLAIGDHRGNSIDGRFFGAVAEDEIYGRAIAIYYRRDGGFGWNSL